MMHEVGDRGQLISVLRRLTEDGGSKNFVILSTGEYYVQFLSCCGSATLYGEAVSERFASLSAKQQAQIRRLGWRPPTRGKYPNFYHYFPVIDDRDRGAIADKVLTTFEVYRRCSDQPLAVELILDGERVIEPTG